MLRITGYLETSVPTDSRGVAGRAGQAGEEDDVGRNQSERLLTHVQIQWLPLDAKNCQD